MKKILLPTDFSASSNNAIDYAMHFFKNWKCEFYILNVQKISEYVSDDLASGAKSDSVYDSIAFDNKKAINDLVIKLKEEHANETYDFHGLYDFDNFVSAVNEAVAFHSIDLIVMGSNGATGAKETLFGSNTLKVIRNSDCPTLTIPEHFKFKNIKSVLFSTQNCEDLTLSGIKVFTKILDMHQPELNILDIDENAQNMSNKEDNTCIKELFVDYEYTYYSLNTIPGLSAVNTATQLLKVDLHAVFIKKETFLDRLLLGSDTSKLVYRTLIPLLFLHR
jgi:nucleotide-binding universal stress UspA family protein